MRPYLAELFSNADLHLGEDWEVLGLTCGQREEGYADLSGGTQEQVSLLVRLALADVLADGDCLPVLLDDPLVHTDPARHEAMLRVLFRASRRLQIVVFSCHDAAFDGLGATARRILPARRA